MMRTFYLFLSVCGFIWGMMLLVELPSHLHMTSHAELAAQREILSTLHTIEQQHAQRDKSVEVPTATARGVFQSAQSDRETIESLRFSNLKLALGILTLSIALFVCNRRNSPVSSGTGASVPGP